MWHFGWQAWRCSHQLSFRVAGVALGDIDLRFAWQAWHLLTSTFVLRGRRGTWRHRPWFYVAGVALDKRFAWQVWRLATALVLRGRRFLATSALVLRGRGGAYSTGLGLVGRPWRRGALRGRRGACQH